MSISIESQVTGWLQKLTESLDLSDDDNRLATTAYADLGKWIEEDSQTRFSADSTIYPHGSMALGTVVRPVDRSSPCDLDTIYCRHVPKSSTSQRELMDQIGEQLRAYIDSRQPNHAGLPLITLERYDQCWTLHYGERFCLDVVPAVPDEDSAYRYLYKSEDGISTTDDKEHLWQCSNPKGYAEWFSCVDNQEILVKRALALMESRVDIEDIPPETRARVKTPLRRAVQILKRHRDICCKDNDFAPTSLIITTMVGKAYQGGTDLPTVLREIAVRLPTLIEMHSRRKYTLKDPSAKDTAGFPAENYLCRWNDDKRWADSFECWVKQLQIDISRWFAAADGGMQKRASVLAESLGRELVEEAVRLSAEGFTTQREQGRLTSSSAGILGAAGAAVRDHRFFGK